jgi:hypothetical protein
MLKNRNLLFFKIPAEVDICPERGYICLEGYKWQKNPQGHQGGNIGQHGKEDLS